jgi:hypothetical protein
MMRITWMPLAAGLHFVSFLGRKHSTTISNNLQHTRTPCHTGLRVTLIVTGCDWKLIEVIS